MRCFYIKSKLQNRITEECRRAQILAQLPEGVALACKAIIRAGTIGQYVAVNY